MFEFEKQIRNEIFLNLNKQLDDTIVEGLKRKGFEFESHSDILNFVKSNCRCEQYSDGAKILFVNDIPFLRYDFKPEFDFSGLKDNKISASYGNFKFL